MATNLQQPIVHPLGLVDNGWCLIIKITTSWLLGTIHHWDGREHTPSSGFGHYLSTYDVISLFVLLNRTLMEIDRLPKILSTGSWSQVNQTTRPPFTTGGGGTYTQTSSLTINFGQTWSEGWNGFDRLIRLILMIQSSLACSRWGSWTGPVWMNGCTRQHKPFDTQPLCTFIPFPKLWSWNPG